MRQWQIEARPSRLAEKRTAPHWQPPVSSGWGIRDGFDVVPVRIEDEGGVVVFAVFGAHAWFAIVLSARLDGCRIEGIDLLAAVGTKGKMRVAGVAAGDPKERVVGPHADDVAVVLLPRQAERRQRGDVEGLRLFVVAAVEADVIDHGGHRFISHVVTRSPASFLESIS